MPKWKFKAFLQNFISLLPYRFKLNYLFQRYVTRGLKLDNSLFEQKLQHAKDHFRFYNSYASRPLENTTILELGTGWMPIVPIAFFLSGAKKIITIDLHSHLRRQLLRDAIEYFIKYHQSGRLKDFLHADPTRMKDLILIYNQKDLSLDELLNSLCIENRIGNIFTMHFREDQINHIISNNVLEHISLNNIKYIFDKFYVLLTPDGIMSHFIDLTDHYAHFDPAISCFHFLKYSPGQWKRYNNKVLYVNRLRFPTYRQLFQDSNFHILQEEKQMVDPEELEAVDLHPYFREYEEQDLLITHCWFICNK